MCRYSTPWRKRTRIATSTELCGHRHLCAGGHSHRLLRGRNAAAKMCWTKLAQVYPKALARDLAGAMGNASGLRRSKLKLSIAGCAKCGHARIGEADHPGPRAAQRIPRDPQDLEGALLVEPVTQALQQKVWTDFEGWLAVKFSPETIEQMYLCPLLVVEVIKAYGIHLYGAGHRLYEFRRLIVFAQQKYPWLKQHMTSAWQLVTKWQSLQPIEHRKPLHSVLYRAMVVLGILHGWHRWAATIVLGFEGIARISEVLKACRGDLVLPSDQFSSVLCAAFLKVSNPKTKRRGKGKVQHLKLCEPSSVAFLEKIFGPLHSSLALFPFSAAAFRARTVSLTNWRYLQLRDLLLPRYGEEELS